MCDLFDVESSESTTGARAAGYLELKSGDHQSEKYGPASSSCHLEYFNIEPTIRNHDTALLPLSHSWCSAIVFIS